MVRRFESADLKRQAQFHEDAYAGKGLWHKCKLAIGAIVSIAALCSPFLSFDEWFSSGRGSIVPEVVPRASARHIDTSASDFSHLDTPSPVDHPAGFDYNLLLLCGVILGFCVIPALLNPQVPPVGGSTNSFGQPAMPGLLAQASSGLFGSQQGLFGSQQGYFGNPYGSQQGYFGLQGPSILTGNRGMPDQHAIGRVVDLKPGEMGYGSRNPGFSNFNDNSFQAAPWSLGGSGWPGAGMIPGQVPGQWPGADAPRSGSWQSPVPSPYSPENVAFGAQAGQQRFAYGGGIGGFNPGFSSSLSGNVPGSFNQLQGSFGSSTFGGGGLSIRGVPSEAEVTETYASHGMNLQQWVPQIIALVEQQILEPLLKSLQASDQQWVASLNTLGWRLTTDRPAMHTNAMGVTPRELSVFDKNLPMPLCNDQAASELWRQRQALEQYLTHPSFDLSQRQYILHRLQEWRQRGIRSSMRFDQRASEAAPTDAHLLELLVMRMLDSHMDFSACFAAAGSSPPRSKFQGQPPAAYLRQVTDQSSYPKPPPHYELVTPTKTWRLRQGNSNLIEALALLLDALRRHPRAFQSFPAALRAIAEPQAAPGGIAGFSQGISGMMPQGIAGWIPNFRM